MTTTLRNPSDSRKNNRTIPGPSLSTYKPGLQRKWKGIKKFFLRVVGGFSERQQKGRFGIID